MKRSTYIALGMMIFTAGLLAVSGCDRLAVRDTLDGEAFALTDQFGEEVTLPDTFLGEVLLVGYVYTHCPDICPIITYNMRDVQRALAEEEGFRLISISFDPDRDTPEVLYEYASNYRLDQSNWSLLTGNRAEVESVLQKLRISTVKTPTRFTEDNIPIYFIDHTDRVTIIDRKGQIRRNYLGSEFDPEEVIRDVRVLLNES
ncbi:MAG: SCO family protein [Balneolaceae bacterium]|nr:MAG: SCO family protein [Balneolaceae bacterium]